MTAIWKKELKAYFHSVMGYLYIAVILFFIGIYFTVYNLLNGFPYLSYALSGVLMVFLIVTPLLTMRILAEEKKQRTDQLLFSSPVSCGRILMGKYLAMLTVFAVPMAVICAYPLILSAFGTAPMAETYTAILGFFLFGAACLAIGLFLSALTENQIIAAILTFAALLFGFLVSGVVSAVAQGNALLAGIASVFDLSGRLSAMMGGVMDFTCVLYFLSVAALFLFFTYEFIQKRKYSAAVRGIRTDVFSAGLIAVVLAVFVTGNYFVSKLPSTITQLDMTQDKLFSITEKSKELLKGLNQDVAIYVLADQENADASIEQLLSRYEDGSSHIKVEYRDPSRYPNFAADYTSDDLSANSLIVVSGDKSKAVDHSLLFQTQMDYASYSEVATGFDGEGQVTSAISYVLSDDRPKMYVITGHDEAAVSDRLSALLSKGNIDWEEINLINYEKVPEDADSIFIFSPMADFSAEDAAKVTGYLEGGGHALIITSWTPEPLLNFEGILAGYGDSLIPGVVAEGTSAAYYQNPYHVLPKIVSGELTESVAARIIYLPFAQGIEISGELRDTVTVDTLLSSTNGAYSKENIEESQSALKEDGDREGPFKLGVLITEPVGDKETRIVHFTTENMLADSVDDAVAGANMELIMRSVRSMTDEKSAITIPVKQYQMTQNVINTMTALTIGGIVTLLVPLGILICGIVVWSRRRKK